MLPTATILLGIAAIDELTSGVPVVAAPDLEHDFGTAHATLTLIVFLVPGAIGAIVEPLLFLLADRWPRHWFMRGGLATMALAALAAAIAPDPVTVSLAIACGSIASGVAVPLAQATLVDAQPDQRGRVLARWTLSSVVGDLAAPVLLALVAFVGSSWRVVYAIVAGVLALWLAALGRVPTPVRGDGGNDPPPLFAQVREALRDRVLVAWLFGKELCGLLDEIFVVFASLHVRLELHASALWQSAIVAAFMIGDAIGLVALDRLLRSRSERGLLALASLGCIVVYVGWLAAPTPLVALVLAVPVGMFVAPLYPLAAAQAYACRPEASGSVLAAGHVFTPLSLALPWLLGLVADRAGTIVALACLLVQPVGLAALVAATRRVTRA